MMIDHPRSVGESYFEHQAAALSYAGPLFLAAFAATLHSVIPGLCQKTGSTIIIRLYARLTGGRGRGAAMEADYTI